jgi:Flp pilus assembly protein TadG
MSKRLDPRDPERGSIAVIVVVVLFVLFGFAALAVDTGFLYTRSRTLQAAADSAVAAGMTDLQAGNLTTAKNDATNMASAFATANGYTLTTNSTTGSTSSQLQITLAMNEPMFFGSIFGFHSKSLTARAAGLLSGVSAPAILALGGCGTGTGINDQGNGPMTINGDVESNGNLSFSNGPSNPVTGSGVASSPCAGQPNLGSGNTSFTGGTAPGGPFPDPFAAAPSSLPTCTYGTLASTWSIPFAQWGAGGVLPPGVYCSGGDLNVTSPAACQCIVANNVSFIAHGIITLQSNADSTITANPAMPDGIVAYTSAAGTCGSGQQILLGSQGFVINGSLYAPNGCVRAGSQGIVTINGSIIGKDVAIGASSSALWTLDPSGGGGGGASWQMVQ